MKKTIIKCAALVLCTAAICLTYAFATPKAEEKVDNSFPAYMTEAQAAEYIGVSEEIITLMRNDLNYFEGAYISYTYEAVDGTEMTELVYSKAGLDEAVKKLMDKSDALNFKYIQEVHKNNESK